MGRPTTIGQAGLVGRDDVLEHIDQLLRRPAVRLVTITGPSGVGKTTLADAVIRRLQRADGVGVACARVDRHAESAGADGIRATLSTPVDPMGPMPAGRRRVVLLDGVESVRDTGDLVAHGLARDAGLVVLATSIVPIALPDEHVVRLGPLDLPTEDATVADLLASGAVQLLLARIADATGDPVDPEHLTSLAALARLLDGLPLALELAAAQCEHRPIDEVVDQVRRIGSLDALGRDPDPTTVHHRDLRSTIAWTYDLLDPRSQRLLRRLGVFAGSFDRSQAGAIAGDDDLVLLERAGLVRRTHGADGGERFDLAPAVTARARELLEAEGALARVQDRHAAHYLDRAEDAAARLRSARTPESRRELVDDLDDLVAAVRHLHDRGHRDLALRLVVRLGPLWEESAAAALAAQLLGGLLPDLDGGDPGDHPDLAAEAWALAATVAVWGQRPVERRGDIDEQLHRAVELARVGGSTSARCSTLRARTAWDLLGGRPIDAVAVATEGLELARATGDPWWTGQFLSMRAAAAVMAGDRVGAAAYASEGRDLALREGDTTQLLRSSHILLGTGVTTSRPTDGSPLTEEELIVLARRVDDAHAEGLLHVGASLARALAQEHAAAASHLIEALDLGRRRGLWYVEELALVATVLLTTLSDRPRDAAVVHGALDDVLPALSRGIPPDAMELYGIAIDRARAAAGEAAFDAAVGAGRLLSWDEVTARARSVCADLSVPAAEPSDRADGPPRPRDVEDTAPAPPLPLTPRQTAVMALLAEGRTNKEIARDLGLRPKTVMHHTSEIYRRLGVRNRTEAVAEARRLGVMGSR